LDLVRFFARSTSSAYRGQRAVIRESAPKARDFTNRRYRQRGVVRPAIARLRIERLESKIANTGSSITSWMSDRGAFRETFARQAIPMTWDFAESNPFADAGGSFATAIDKGSMAIADSPAASIGSVVLLAAQRNSFDPTPSLLSTDPPYYDNIGYADLSDFFYVWLRRSLSGMCPELFRRLTTPKAEELVATPYRHGSQDEAEKFFMQGMGEALSAMRTAVTSVKEV
jgi:putative DNA methylase